MLRPEDINEERETHGRPKVVRGSNVLLTSHAGLNPRSKSGNEPGRAGELSRYMFRLLKT